MIVRSPYKPEEKELNHLIQQYGEEHFKELEINTAEVELMRPVGCEKCGDTGYRGRTGVHELLLGNQ